VTKCYSDYNPGTKSTASYSVGEGVDRDSLSSVARAFTWSSARDNRAEGVLVPGLYGFYDGSGFTLDITNLTTAYLVDSFNFLLDNGWLDRQTRGIFVSMVLYNANFNLHAVVSFYLENSPAGVLKPGYKMSTIKMDLYANMADLFAIVTEGFLYAFLLLYLCNEIGELYRVVEATGKVNDYIDPYNAIDWMIVIFSYLALGFRLRFFNSKAVREFDPFTNEYIELADAAEYYNLSYQIDSLAAFLCFLRFFRYCDLQRNLHILRTSIIRGLSALSFFTMMLVLVIFAFSIAGNNIFGQEYADFVTEPESFKALFLMILGEFDFEELQRIHGAAAILFFVVYQVIVFFIMVNIFLAILNDAYIAVVEQFNNDPEPEREHLTFMQRIKRLQAWYKKRRMEKQVEALRKDGRKRDLADRRTARRLEEEQQKRLSHMNLLSCSAVQEAATSEGVVVKKAGRAKRRGDAGGNAEAAQGEEPSTMLLQEALFGTDRAL